MRKRLRNNIATLFAIMTLTCVALLINTRPPHVRSHTGKGSDVLHAERGWPFHYLDVYEDVPKGQAAQYIDNGWPLNSRLPVVSNMRKLLANIVLSLAFIVGLPIATRLAIAYLKRKPKSRLSQPAPDPQQRNSLRIRIIPTTLLLVLGIPGLIIGFTTFVFAVWKWVDITLSDYTGGMLFSPGFNYWFSESCLAIVASVLLLLAAKACWKSSAVLACALFATGLSIAFVLILVLQNDVYNGWDDYVWPLTDSR